MAIIPISEYIAGDRSYYLGKKFQQAIDASLDQNYINECRRKIEDIKLQIIDAAENGKLPPSFDDCGWLYELYYKKRYYSFVFKEFDQWLSFNGLAWNFEGYGSMTTLRVAPNTFTKFEDVPEPDTKSWLNNLRNKPE